MAEDIFNGILTPYNDRGFNVANFINILIQRSEVTNTSILNSLIQHAITIGTGLSPELENIPRHQPNRRQPKR